MAYDEKFAISELPHNLIMEGRKKLSLTGVTDVDSFNEQEVTMEASGWMVSVRGDGLHMEKLSVDSGDVIITGRIDAIEYEDGAAAGGGFFSRIFR